MRINNNIMAMNTHRQYAVNNDNVSKSTEKLSSGYRINRAGDDAAGLAISEKMRAQIRGLNMASKNSQDAISLIQTAEGALTETHAILQRMSELATQSASDTNQDNVDREALNSEFTQLKSEIDDISNKTTFNKMDLLKGTFGVTNTVNTAAGNVAEGVYGITDIKLEGFTDTTTDAGNTTWTIAFTGVAPANYTATLSNDDTTPAFTSVAVSNVPNPADGTARTSIIDFGNGRKVTIEFSTASLQDDLATHSLIFTSSGTGGQIQTGANSGDTLSISIGNMSVAGLNLTASTIDTQANASSAMTSVQSAINTVSTERAKLGALQNRLQHKINNLDTASENLSAAESRIRDLDMAAEMTTFTKNNILVQAATAMLAQANAAPQQVLNLLK
jgi:flagellin